ncbi:MAG: LTA synthase family protein, partial [Collinsella aerofaciens]|nr:LTA synthase family protein [Collinsella aerofaciens]
MFAAAISLVGLAATVHFVLREIKTVKAQSGTVAKGAIAWSVTFGLFQVFLTIWGAVGLVAQNEPLAFVMLILTNAILTGCAWASIARDRIAPRVFAFAATDAPA